MIETPSQFPVSPVPPPVVRAKSSSRLGTGILALAALVAIGGVAFAAGRVTAPTATAATGTGSGNGFSFNRGTGTGGTGNGTGLANRFGGGENGGVTLRGTVQSISATSLTLQLANGTSVTIPIDSSTTYHSQQAASSSDVTAGTTVLVEVSGFGGRVGNGETNGAGAGSPAAGSFAPPSFGPDESPGASRVPGQLGTLGPARDITIAVK